MKLNYLIIAMFTFVLFPACENENENETKISQNNTDESHNLGQNCMNCHVSGGDGEGWFTIAGSLYDKSKTVAYPNGSVKLTSEPNGSGTTIIIVDNDIKGNFYSTEEIDFGEGLFAGIYGTNGEQKFMTSKITTGACNACHGTTTAKLWME